MKYFNWLVLCSLVFMPVYVFSYTANELPTRKTIVENQELNISVMPEQRFEVVFDSDNVGTWKISVSHSTELLSKECGEVYYTTSESPEDDGLLIVEDREICYGQGKYQLLVKEIDKMCFKILITQRSDLIMDLKIKLTAVSTDLPKELQ